MNFKLACGHTRVIGFRESFYSVLSDPCWRCIAEANEKAHKEATK